jgi:hypothetical protein
VVHFTRVTLDIDRAGTLQAIFRFDEKNGRWWLLVTEFCCVLGKGSDGAP